jgi:Flp pilus assembly protein TadD
VSRKGVVFWLVTCLCLTACASAQGQGRSPEWWWAFSPAGEVPLGMNAVYYSPGGGLDISAEYLNPSLGGLALLLGLDFGYVPAAVSGVGGLVVAAPSAGAAFQVPIPVLPGVSARVFTKLGYSYVGFYEHVSSPYLWYGMDPFFEAGAGISYALNPSLTLRLDASYLSFYQLYGALSVTAGVAFTSSHPPQVGPALPDRPKLLDFSQARIESVFPVFHAFYDEHALGTVRIQNTGARPISDIRVSFVIKQYMDGPKECARIATLGPGESHEVPLFALLNTTILGVTETTKATGEMDASYRDADGSEQQGSATASVTVYDRNAMSWDDDRKAAAFVSPKDPWVLDLSNNVISIVKDLRNPGVDRNLQTAIAFHDALRVYGLAYSPNPGTPYSYTSAHPQTVDFLKFPRQTLSYRAGDCSDLSILYASLFESVGIQTAFITIPGHIFMAISLDMSPEQAKARLPDSGELIFKDDTVWLPIETTMRDRGLLDAWKEAAREWRQGQADGTAAFYPVREAWQTYAPAGLAADATAPQVPAEDLVKLAFSAELSHRVDDELSAAVAPLDQSIRKDPTPRAYNSRGAVFARYGRLDRAESDFNAALDARSDYVWALVNLGNLATLRSDVQAAYGYFRRAVAAGPRDARALLALSTAAATLGNNEEARQAFASAQLIDPRLAETYGAPGAESGTRAAQQGTPTMEWEEE